MVHIDKRLMLAGSAVLSSCLYIVAISTPYWISENGDGSIGLFESQHRDSNFLFPTNCNADMGELECSYLYSSKISAVATVIFGGIASMLYLLPTVYFAVIPKNIPAVCVALEIIFAIITAVVFYYFKASYFSNDDINVEYPVEEPPSLSLYVSFGIWLVATILSGLTAAVLLFYQIKDKGYCGKNRFNNHIDSVSSFNRMRYSDVPMNDER
mmetsp:Transcript_22643/g.31034  ORF Transcript_22643/g.31034 Transcript_22643/m.31034 type:complete len:212 (+) Transcript_22643:30-665(+)